MKPGFIIIVILGVILGWAVLQSSYSNISELDKTVEREMSPGSERTQSSSRSGRTSTIDINTYGRAVSPFIGQIELRRARARDDDPKEEYIELRADDDNMAAVTITGWRLESIIHNRTFVVGSGTLVPIYPERNVANSSIILNPDDRAYLISGNSPLSVSFRTNKCIGYIGQNRTFHPRLPRECPAAENENLAAFGIDKNAREGTSDYECVRELKRIRTCEDPGAPDDDLNNDCKDYIRALDYRLCAGLHRNDPDFLGNEWYIYAERGTVDLWDDEDDTILLLDASGRVVDSISY